MKIAVPSTLPNLDGHIECKLGTAAHLLVVDTDDMSFEVMEGPPRSSGAGAGLMVLTQVVNMGVQVVLVEYIAPNIIGVLKKQGIEVVSSVSGPVGEAITNYMRSRSSVGEKKRTKDGDDAVPRQAVWSEALRKGGQQFSTLLPRLVGVILLLGLFRGFVSEQTLLSLFSNSPLYDAVCGASIGSLLAGNPVNSYIIGKSLLSAGVGVAGAAALMFAWVNVGIIQLPAEVAALGMRFALVRNIAGFILAILMALLFLLLAGGAV